MRVLHLLCNHFFKFQGWRDSNKNKDIKCGLFLLSVPWCLHLKLCVAYLISAERIGYLLNASIFA